MARDRPTALLLDFGGVLVDVFRRPSGIPELADEVQRFLKQTGCDELDRAAITEDLASGLAAWAAWKNAQCRPAKPTELTQRAFWEDLVVADWPPAARAAVIAHASVLSRHVERCTQHRPPKEGMREVLKGVTALGVRVGCVSNSLAGSVSREILEETGLDQYLSVVVFSDEVGIRKPNPDILLLASTSLDASPHETWYVGDTVDRDILCARRAGLARAILMTKNTPSAGLPVRAEPDDVVHTAGELLELVRGARHLHPATAGGV